MFKEIAKNAVIQGLFDIYPPASCRREWESLPSEYKNLLISAGERWLDHQFSPIYATEYMDFCRTGNRSRYEEKLFERRTILNALVLAECVQHKGRYMDTIINGLFLICQEAAWQLPAHNTYVRDTPQFPLPNVTRPIVDLFAAETGAVVAMAEYLLREELEKISPAVSVLVNHNLETRIFTPYLEEHFWWMGDGKSHMNNWTSWCTQNVLLAAFTRALPQETRRRIVEKACRSLDYFLAEYGEDGCCDEGAQYYRYAGLTLFGSMEILNKVCLQGFERLYREPKIRNIADYIVKVHVAGPYYINFADCSPLAGVCGAREYLFGKRTGSRGLMDFAAEDYQSRTGLQQLDLEEHSLLYRVQAAFCHREMTEYRPEKSGPVPDCYFPSAGLFVVRDHRFCLAVKAGDNNDSHNHNDVGSFTIYKDGKPVFIDVGVESYTKKTFSPERYEIWTMQSQYHNLPAFGGVMERDGEEFAASSVEYELGEHKSWIQMELAGAYPDNCVESYVRRVCLEKGKGICVTDRCTGNAGTVVLSLMTCERPEFVWEEAVSDDRAPEERENQGIGAGKIANQKTVTGRKTEERAEADAWRSGASRQTASRSSTSGDQIKGSRICKMNLGTLACCRIEGAACVEIEEIPITDPRLKTAWPRSVFRALVTFAGTEMRLEIR